MATILGIHEQKAIFERILNAHTKVQERLLRTTQLLASAGIPYAVMGGNAVAAWVATRDESLVRNTRDVDVLVRRSDLDQIRELFESHGFVYQHVGRIDVLLDGPDSKAGDGVHLLFASEKIGSQDAVPAPDVVEAEEGESFRVLGLEALVRTKLVAWHLKDRVHLQDLVGAGLVDEAWPARFPAPLGERLQSLLDDPEG